MLGNRALAIPPSIAPVGFTVLIGEMGVGKTTELERLHRMAIDRALNEHSAPIPFFFTQGRSPALPCWLSLRNAPAVSVTRQLGAHLVIDGLDEAGIQIADLVTRIATLQATWPNSTVIVSSRPQNPLPGLRTEILEALVARGCC